MTREELERRVGAVAMVEFEKIRDATADGPAALAEALGLAAECYSLADGAWVRNALLRIVRAEEKPCLCGAKEASVGVGYEVHELICPAWAPL